MPTSANESRAAEANAFEPTVTDIPRNAGVVLAFHGLMCFCHNTVNAAPFCEIGIHNKALDTHIFEMKVQKVDRGFDPPRFMDITKSETEFTYTREHTGSSPGSIVTFRANDPSEIDEVAYLENASTLAVHNFSHVPDLEGPKWYGEFITPTGGGQRILGKKVDAFGPVVHVENGLLYTLVRTKKKTKRHKKDDPASHVKKLGKVSEFVAANIYLHDGGSVDLITQIGTRNLKPTGDYKYLVTINNLCPRGVCAGIDFDLYDRTFDLPVGAPRLVLALDEDRNLSGEEKSGEEEESDHARAAFFEGQKQLERSEELKSDDDAPCGEAGFGSSNCLICA